MSKPWKPDEELLCICEAEPKPRWPEGASVGLAVLGVACLGALILISMLAGPRDVFRS